VGGSELSAASVATPSSADPLGCGTQVSPKGEQRREHDHRRDPNQRADQVRPRDPDTPSDTSPRSYGRPSFGHHKLTTDSPAPVGAQCSDRAGEGDLLEPDFLHARDRFAAR
jgi:hypothetical protein